MKREGAQRVAGLCGFIIILILSQRKLAPLSHTYIPHSVLASSADTLTEPDNDSLVSSSYKRKHSLCREISFQHRDRRTKRETRGRVINYLVGGNLTINNCDGRYHLKRPPSKIILT